MRRLQMAAGVAKVGRAHVAARPALMPLSRFLFDGYRCRFLNHKLVFHFPIPKERLESWRAKSSFSDALRMQRGTHVACAETHRMTIYSKLPTRKKCRIRSSSARSD